jgi:uncharacterized protein YdeI (YjbR/CyaY-like superfamily)
MGAQGDLPVIAFESQDAFEAWLAEHHATSKGLQLKIAKKGSVIPSVTYAEAVDVALCYGWIDSQKSALDADYFLQRFTPRSARGKWSRVNCDKAMALVEQGRMRPAGLHEIERARADGRWEAAYEPQSTAAVPDDLRRALDANPAARAFFATLDSRNRYAVLHRVHDAKRPETRARRIEKFVAMLAAGEKIYP